MASLIWSWKPFLDELWAASASTTRSRATQGCIWTKQISSSVNWLVAFMHHEKGEVSRTWSLEAHLTPAHRLPLVFDASPWGIGAVLYRDGVPLFYFISALTKYDEQRFRYKIGDHKGQQTWESLSVLVALKTWQDQYMGRRFSLTLVKRG